MSTLLDCPLCGCPAMLRGGGSSKQGPVPYSISCASALCGLTLPGGSDKEQVKAAWNTRIRVRRLNEVPCSDKVNKAFQDGKNEGFADAMEEASAVVGQIKLRISELEEFVKNPTERRA